MQNKNAIILELDNLSNSQLSPIKYKRKIIIIGTKYLKNKLLLNLIENLFLKTSFNSSIKSMHTFLVKQYQDHRSKLVTSGFLLYYYRFITSGIISQPNHIWCSVVLSQTYHIWYYFTTQPHLVLFHRLITSGIISQNSHMWYYFTD